MIVIHILSSISRSKGNEAMKFGQLTEYNIMKFGQLTEYNMRNIFLK